MTERIRYVGGLVRALPAGEKILLGLIVWGFLFGCFGGDVAGVVFFLALGAVLMYRAAKK